MKLETYEQLCSLNDSYANIAVDRLDEPDRTGEIRKLLSAYAEKQQFNDFRAILQLVPKEKHSATLNTFIQESVARGNLLSAQQLAKWLRRDLTKEELELILANQIEEGLYGPAKRTLLIIGREFTENELESLFLKSMKEDNDHLAGVIAKKLLEIDEPAQP